MSEITLKVAEAVKKDVGRGLTRIDPADIERLHATIGDIVEIVGKKRTVAKVMPAFKEDRGKGIIQIDGPTRGNAHIGLDEKVTIKKQRGIPQIMSSLPQSLQLTSNGTVNTLEIYSMDFLLLRATGYAPRFLAADLPILWLKARPLKES